MDRGAAPPKAVQCVLVVSYRNGPLNKSNHTVTVNMSRLFRTPSHTHFGSLEKKKSSSPSHKIRQKAKQIKQQHKQQQQQQQRHQQQGQHQQQ